MKRQHGISRRKLTRYLGIASGFALLRSSFAIGKTLQPTPHQTEGPFYPVVEQMDKDLDLTRIKGHSQSATGETILVRGQVLDTRAQPLKNAVVDVWQANHHGRYSHPADRNQAPLDPHFQGWGVIKTDDDGWYNIRTIKPGAYPLSAVNESGWRPRHLHFKVAQPGFKTLDTQMYFRGDPLIANDLVVSELSTERRELLIVDSALDEASGLPLFRFDIVLNTA